MQSPKARFGVLLSTLMGCFAVGLLSLLWVEDTQALPTSKHGAVMARAVVTDPETGKPILVEYNTSGEEVRELPLPDDYKAQTDRLKIISADSYRQEQDRLSAYQTQYENTLALGAELLSRNQFLQATFKPAGAESDNDIIIKPVLPDNINSVLVRAEHNRIGANQTQELVLLSFTANLAENYIVPSEAKTLVLTEQGNVIASSPNNIAYRVGFYGDASDPQAPRGSSSRTNDDTIFGPVSGVRVSVSEFAYPGGIGATDSQGKYHLNYYLPLCPVGGFEFTTDVYAELHYQNFRPTGSPTIPYFLRRQDWDYCFPEMIQVHPLQPPVYFPGSPIVKNYAVDMWVDVMFLNGLVTLKNPDGTPVPISDKTEYLAFSEPAEAVVQTNYDFNGDGVLDHTFAGNMVNVTDEEGNTVKQFKVDDTSDNLEPDIQAVYYELPDFSVGAEYTPPDLTRVIDTEQRLLPVGYLTSISREDYQNTDILVFRESTGELIVERIGLRDEEIDGQTQAKYYDETKKFFYSIMLRGPMDFNDNIGGTIARTADFSDFNSSARLSEPYQQRDADHLKPGESVRIVAINRATGYMGTARVKLGSASDNLGNLLNTPVEDIALTPPNLKIWAERDYDVEKGLTAGEQRNYLIGSEGAALTSDQQITLYSEWLDHDGSPLPEGLGSDRGEQYGYTGRIAKIVATNQLEAASIAGHSDLAEFPISPGRHLQVLKIGSNLTVPEHYYVHVNGTPKDEGPDFSSGMSVGALPPYDSRPAKLTPFLSPLFDENSTWKAANDYRELSETTNVTEPLPTYAWQYRPEYQFSQYELEMQAINKVNENPDGSVDSEDILDLTNPVIASSDDLITMMYSLISSEFDSLTPIDGPQDLILAIGEQEIKITVDADQTITFDNIEHLAELDTEDYLTMRLYTNNDAGNVLWEYAFEYVALDSDDSSADAWNDGYYELSADDTSLGLQGWLFAQLSENLPVSTWSLEGDGELAETGYVQGSASGYFSNSLTMPALAGSEALIVMKTSGSDSAATFGPVRVIPGVPKNVSLDIDSTSIHILETGETIITATVTDNNGNRVVDGTPVDWNVRGDARLISSEITTLGGVATAVLVGGNKAGQATVIFKVDEIEQEITKEILPLNISIDAPSIVSVGDLFDVNVSVTDSEDLPVSDVLFLPSTSVGRVKRGSSKTDVNGTASFRILAKSSPVEGVVGALLGEQAVTVPLEVRPVDALPYVANNILLVGDKPTEGSVSANWIADINVDVPYKVNESLIIRGVAGDEVVVKLGSPGIPVLTPILSYPMTTMYSANTVYDRVGRLPGTSEYVSLSNDGPLGVGSSYEFKKEAWTNPEDISDNASSKILAADVSSISLSNQIGFRVDLKALVHGGDVFTIGSGQSLTFNEAGSLVYHVTTDTGSVALTSAPLTLDQWYNITGEYRNGTVKLNINTANGSANVSSYEEVLLGKINYGIETPILTIGDRFEGRMRGFDLYDWTRTPLVTLNGSNEQVVTLDAEGKATLQVQSNGVFTDGIASEAKLGLLQKLPLTLYRQTDSATVSTSYITLTTEETYQALMEEQVSNSPVPESAIVAMLNRHSSPPLSIAGVSLFSTAHAGVFDWVPSVEELKAKADQAIDIVAEAATWVVPYDDVMNIAEQLEFRNSGNPDYNPMLLTASSISVLSVIPTPFTKVLKPIMKPIKTVAKTVGKGAFGQAFAKKFLKLARDCVDGRGSGSACKQLERLLPFIEMVGYMYLADPETFEELILTVQSEEDFLVLFEFLTIENIQPEWFGIDLEETTDLTPHQRMFQFIGIQTAYANGSSTLIKAFGRGFLKVFKELKQQGVITHDVSVIKIFKPFVALKPWLKEKDRSKILKQILNIKFLKMIAVTSSRKGVDTVVGIVKGYTGQRIPQPITWGMLYYLLVEQKDYFTEEVNRKIWLKVGAAFFDISEFNKKSRLCAIDDKNEESTGSITSRLSRANGALFHLSQVASLRLQGANVVDIERTVRVPIYDKNNKEVGNWGRDTDIIVDDGGQELLIETKSLSARKGQKSIWKEYYFSEWTKLSATKTSLMRQFMLDRVLAGTEDPEDKIRWYFDTFKNKATAKCNEFSGGFYEDNDIKAARKVMVKLPPWFRKGNHADGTFGISLFDYEQKYAGSRINDIVLAEGFLDKAFNILVEKNHTWFEPEEVEEILSQFN